MLPQCVELLFQDAKHNSQDEELTQFTLDHLQGIFYIYLIALGISIIIFGLEIILDYFQAVSR